MPPDLSSKIKGQPGNAGGQHVLAGVGWQVHKLRVVQLRVNQDLLAADTAEQIAAAHPGRLSGTIHATQWVQPATGREQ